MRPVAEIRKTFCLQSYHHDCGAACINSILGYFNLGKIDALKYVESEKGVNLLAIKQTLSAYSIEVDGYRCSDEQLPTLTLVSLIVVKQDGENHAVLIYPNKKEDGDLNFVLVGNPASGIYWQDTREIKWEGIIMTFKYQTTLRAIKPIIKDVLSLQYQSYKRHFLNFNVIIFWGLIINFLTILLPIVFQTALDYFKLHRNQEKIFSYVLLICFILLIRGGISYVRKNLIANFASDYYYENMATWFTDIGKSKSSFWATLNHGDFNKLLKEQHQLQQLNLLSMIEIVSDVFLLLFIIGLTFYYSLFIGGLLLLFILINQFYIFSKAEVLGQEQEDLKIAQASAEQSFIVCCSQFDLLKAHGYGATHSITVLKHFTNLYCRIRDYGLLQNRLQLVSDMISHVFYGVVVYSILHQYCEQAITLGQMLTLIGLVYYSLPIVAKITNGIKFYYEQIPNLGKQKTIRKLGETDRIKIEEFEGLRIVNGKHLYCANAIDFVINKGDFILVKGENGVGKSTLLNLIAGNVALTTGSLFINNERMQDEYTICGLSYLKQDAPIFDATVRYNITLSNDIDNDFDKFIQLFSLGNFLDQFEDKEQKVLCHSRQNLSGGQRKVLGFARALYKKPKILLLDEPELGLDKNNLNWLLGVLPVISKRTTIIICSHSKFYDGMVNRIYELK